MTDSAEIPTLRFERRRRVLAYVACSSQELSRAEHATLALESRGVRVTLDWTFSVRDLRSCGLTDADLTDEDAQIQAAQDAHGVRRADVMLFLAPTTLTRGAWFEFGMAHGLGRTMIVSGPAARASIFTRLAERIFETDSEAIEWIASRSLPERHA